MHRDALEKAYRELPSHHRDRWPTFDAFHALANTTQHLDLPFEAVREANAKAKTKLPRAPEKNEFGGLASAFGVKIDTWIPSYIEPGAFKNTLKNDKERARVKVLYQHFSPIGVPTFMEEVQEGLLVMGRVSETSLGSDVLTLMRDQVVTEMSIGFDPVEFYFKEGEDKELHRHITEVRLWEFSPVSFGANSGAKITVVNSLPHLGNALDLDALMERLEAHFVRKQQVQTPEQIRAEIERLTALLPAPQPTFDHRAELEQLARLEALAL